VGAGIGGNLVNRAWVEAGQYEKITEVAQALVAAVN
jgi:2-keto-3-deoxy-6-phosphogluconate aldolase